MGGEVTRRHTCPVNRRRLIRGAAVAVVLVLVVLALAKSGRTLLDELHHLSVTAVLLAGVATLLGLGANLLCWRVVLADLGSQLPLAAALRVFFLGQLGKYVPGSVWPVLAQMELGKEHGVPRSRSATAGLLTVVMSLVTAPLVAAVTLPFTSPEALRTYWYVFLVVPLIGVGLVPRVANRLLDRVFRLARRGGLSEPLTGAGIAGGLVWAALAWVLFGLQVALIAHDLGAPAAKTVLLSIGAFALAWSIGFLFVIAPAGLGVREGAIVLGMSPVLTSKQALLVALVSRALMSLSDGLLAGVAVLAARKHRVRRTRG
jgi:uncharacterized membrane protein YbhN (UPF0104 family)